MQDKTDDDFVFVGNALWLDFVNTEVVIDSAQKDLLKPVGALGAWLTRAGLSMPATGSGQRPEPDLLDQALQLRLHLRFMADQMANDSPPPEEAITAVNALLQGLCPQLVWSSASWTMELQASGAGGSRALAAIARSAADTLSSGDPQRVRKCEGRQCILYFLDTSKNHRRRWCRMDTCGNRRKASLHYRKTKPQAAA